jgi:glucose-1-phosphate thymidylyltransferase
MILGDNIFCEDVSQDIKTFESGGRVFAKKVSDPERYGVVKFDDKNKALQITEKPKKWISDYCVTGLYIYDRRVVQMARNLKPSERGEIEITDLNNEYLNFGELDVRFVKGEWFDAGTFDSLLSAGVYASEHQDFFSSI